MYLALIERGADYNKNEVLRSTHFSLGENYQFPRPGDVSSGILIVGTFKAVIS